MTFTATQVRQLLSDLDEVAGTLRELQFRATHQSTLFPAGKLKDHLSHGAGRRLHVIRSALLYIFEHFPPTQATPLPRDSLTEIQAHLHAFVINVSGFFDNLAWAFVLRHDFETAIGDRTRIGMFKNGVLDRLPAALRTYLKDENIERWHQRYLKGYRDALAHRIPLYIPPAAWTDADKVKYEQIEEQKAALIEQGRWDDLDALWNEQDKIGSPCFVFMHEYAPDEDARPVFLHPQTLCDAKTVVEYGNLFFEHWHEHA